MKKGNVYLSEGETQRLIHELRVHQIELEAQNEELRVAKQNASLAVEKYTELYDYAPLGYYTITPDGTIYELNLMGAQMLGKDRASLVTRNIRLFIAPKYLPVFNEFVRDVFKFHFKHECEVKMALPDGASFYIHFDGLVSEDRQKCFLTAVDVTAIRKATKMLHSNFEILRIAGKSARFGGWSIDISKNKLLWSDEVAAIHEMPAGHSPEFDEAINYYAPEWRAKISEAIADCISEGTSFDEEMEVITAKGKHIWVRMIGEAIRDKSGKITKVQGAFQDITERKHEQEALQKSESRFKAMFDNSSVGIYQTDADGKCQVVNKKWCDFAGLSPEEALGDGWQRALHPDDRERMFSFWNEFALSRKPWNFEYRFCTPDQKITWVLGTAVPLLNDNNEITGYLGMNTDITERKQAEEALLISEDKFRKAFESNPGIVAISTLDEGRYIEINQHFTDLLEWERHEVIGRTSTELGLFCDPSERNTLKKLMMRDGNLRNYDAKMKTKSGQIRIGSFSAEIIEMGGLKCLFSQVEDLTERKLAEEALLWSEMRFRSLLQDVSSVSVQGYALDGTTQYWNKASEKLYGYTSEEAMGRNLLDLIIPPEMHPDVQQAIELMDETAQPIPSSELSLMRKDGSRVSVYSSHAIVESPGKPNELFCIDIDLTELKQAEREILKQKQQYDSLVSKIPVGVYILRSKPDGAFALEYASPRMAEMLGMNIDFLLNHHENIFEAIHPDDLDGFVRLNEEGIENTVPFDWKGRVFVNGEIRWMHISSMPQLQDDGDVLWHGQIVDITDSVDYQEEIRRKNEELINLNATKDKFFSIIAHDLKGPFNSILGFSSLLTRQIQEKDFASIGKYAGIIEGASQQALDLLMNLLEWSRSQTGQIKFSPEQLEMSAVIDQSIDLLFGLAQEKSIIILTEIPVNFRVFADMSMIATILRNLITNAIKFSHPEGEILISGDQTAKEFIISVKDNGVGIKKESISKLFRIGEIQSTLGTRKEKGTGLGLLLCKEFIEKQGGRIWVESEPGAGSIFSFSIPKV
jgi:PAS domain S-box-containing protein